MLMSELTSDQAEFAASARAWAAEWVAPRAATWEREAGFDREAVAAAAAAGYLGGTLPSAVGGLGWNTLEYGLFSEALARHSVSFAALFNVHTMVSQTLLKWGSRAQRESLLPALARGERLGAIAFSEPGAGSDLKAMTTRFTRDGEDLLIRGEKRWITCGAVADLVLVFGWLDDQAVAAVVPTATPGLTVEPMPEMLGFRAAHLAALHLDDCRVPASALLGRPGFALNFLAPYALEYGRIHVAWACLGMLRGCFESACDHVVRRQSFGKHLIDHGMVQSLVARIGIDHQTSSLLCLRAARLRDAGHDEAGEAVLAAKYQVAVAAARAASDAVQLLGARGCEFDHVCARHYRDAKTMEIIEGSNQIMEFLLARGFAAARRREVAP